MANRALKPAAFQPPPEARPRIISNITIRPPSTPATDPPPLAYIATPRRIRIAHSSQPVTLSSSAPASDSIVRCSTSTHFAAPTSTLVTPKPEPYPTPVGNLMPIDKPTPVGNPIPVITTQSRADPHPSTPAPPKSMRMDVDEEGPTTSRAAAAKAAAERAQATAKPKDEPKKKSSYRRFSEEEVFGGVRIPRPKVKPKHMQYLIRRPGFPPLKVKILDDRYARLQCQGYEKVVEMQ